MLSDTVRTSISSGVSDYAAVESNEIAKRTDTAYLGPDGQVRVSVKTSPTVSVTTTGGQAQFNVVTSTHKSTSSSKKSTSAQKSSSSKITTGVQKASSSKQVSSTQKASSSTNKISSAAIKSSSQPTIHTTGTAKVSVPNKVTVSSSKRSTTTSATLKAASSSAKTSSKATTSSVKTSLKATTSSVKTSSKASSSSRAATSSSKLPTRTTTTTLTSTSTVQPSKAASGSSTITKLTSLTPSAVQTASSGTVETSGSIIASLETSGNPSVQPFPTSAKTATSAISLINTSSTTLPQAVSKTTQTAMTANNIFVAIATDAPPSQIPQRADHPVPRVNIASQAKKLETNKFYANFFLGSQADSTFTHPYSVSWSKGSGGVSSWGLSISHIERSQLAYGSGSPAPYYINPIGIQSMILSAKELGSSTTLTTDSLDTFSINVNLLSNNASTTKPAITFPLVQGMGFVTGIYTNATPVIQSSVGVSTLKYVGLVAGNKTYKYRANLNDGTAWMFYVTPSSTTYPGNTFTLLSGGNSINATAGFSGTIQIAKVPSSTSDAATVYDSSAGAYAITGSVSGSVNGVTGNYKLSWTKAGNTAQTLLMWALPHHNQTLSSRAGVTDLSLATTTKGYATAVLADAWTLTEPNLPVDMGFAPWSPSLGSVGKVSAAAAKLINSAGTAELSQDIVAQTNLNSMYYSGKGLAKFAGIIYALHDVVGNNTLAYTGLAKLQSAFATFVNNKQVIPLAYDSAWGGAVSSASYDGGDSGADFGNTFYNDHHFHYGYFVYAAAIIGYLDPAWVNNGTNKAWVNMLVRDYANSISNDPYFPMSRSFDWYHGHSWAKGLFESGDGKDQESSSEDTNAAYAIKMWGKTINDTAMEARGNLMLGVQARSVQNYFLFQSNNTVEPANFIGNKVSGIMFENKMDHTTYFGSNTEYIQGIHMLPLLPFSTLSRTKTFVTEEWDTYFSNGRADNVQGGWRGVLYANLAIIDPATSWSFFSNTNFDLNLLDGGASLTWYRTWSAALGGSPAATTSKRAELKAVPNQQANHVKVDAAKESAHAYLSSFGKREQLDGTVEKRAELKAEPIQEQNTVKVAAAKESAHAYLTNFAKRGESNEEVEKRAELKAVPTQGPNAAKVAAAEQNALTYLSNFGKREEPSEEKNGRLSRFLRKMERAAEKRGL